jgi:hypothetical protein
LDHQFTGDIENAFQALALDERQYQFQPEVWKQKGNYTERIKQCWFRPAHSDVGGGDNTSGLANLSFSWMVSQLRPFIQFDNRKIRDLAVNKDEVILDLTGIAKNT